MISCGWILINNINEIDCSTFNCWFPVPSPGHFPVTFISSASLSYFFPLPRSPCHPSLPGAWFLFAPGVRSRCRPVTCASRCVRKVAPRSPAPHPSPPCGLPFLPGARFPFAPGTWNGGYSMICSSRCELAVEYLDSLLICLYLADGKGMEFRPWILT